MKPYASIWVTVLAVILVGCRGRGGEEAQAVASTPQAGAPPPVEQAEGLAEDVQSDIRQNSWPAAEAKARELRTLPPRLDSAGVAQPKRDAYKRAVESLGAAIAARSGSEALTAGNQVSRVVAGIMLDFPAQVPGAVAYMDVAGRDVLYAAQQGRWSDAVAPVAEVARSYAAVQPYVRSRNFALDQQVSSEITQLRRGVATREQDRVSNAAQALLDEVDRIELIY